jgi:hypothetical protein
MLNYIIDREGDERCWGLDRPDVSAHLLAIWFMAKAPTAPVSSAPKKWSDVAWVLAPPRCPLLSNIGLFLISDKYYGENVIA